MRVLVLAEDPRLDQYMLKPLVKAALTFGGKPTAKVQVCQDRSQRGQATVASAKPILDIIALYPTNDAYVLCMDRDCQGGRLHALEDLAARVNSKLVNQRFVAVAGIEELEVWALAGMDNLTAEWQAIREHCHPKETFFEPYADSLGVSDTPGRGRKLLGEEAAKKYAARVRARCPEIQVCEKLHLEQSQPIHSPVW